MVRDGSPGREPLLLSTSRPAPGVLVVHVDGELDMWTVPALEHYLQEETLSPVDDLVLDLSEVTFLGSHGCALLVRLSEEAGAPRFRVAGAQQRPVRRILEITGLTTVVTTCPDLAGLLDGRS